jgi:surface polysaccharide O-acyltransferase-like enzyme
MTKAEQKNIKACTKKYSYVRAMSCIAIIAIHMVYSSLVVYQDSITDTQKLGCRIAVNNLMWAVPCFFMVTGALLLDPNRALSYKKLFTRYIFKLLMVILVFNIIYSISDMFLNGNPGTDQILNGVYKAFTGKTWSHMWYLYTLFGIYLMLPLYRMIAEKSKLGDIRYLLAVFFVFISLVPLLDIFEISCGFDIPTATIYPFWIFMGYAIHQGFLRNKRVIPFFMFVSGTALLVMATWFRWNLPAEGLEKLFSYSSPLVITQAVGFYQMIGLADNGKTGTIRNLLMWIDKRSFGIYLVHLIFIRWMLRYFHINPFAMVLPSGVVLALLVLLVLVLSGIVVWILQKIPLVNKLV